MDFWLDPADESSIPLHTVANHITIKGLQAGDRGLNISLFLSLSTLAVRGLLPLSMEVLLEFM